jgi:hypothetical protein
MKIKIIGLSLAVALLIGAQAAPHDIKNRLAQTNAHQEAPIAVES